jgi:hypothetical protein
VTPPTAGSLRAEQQRATVEVRSFELASVNGLWPTITRGAARC